MDKKAYFYIDDCIWSLQELTQQRPASLFDQHFFKVLKTAHDLYGAKFQMNLFYRTDFFYGNEEFTLADVTDAYREEFTAASDWLHFSLHSKQEFPDYPWVNAAYQDVKDVFESIRREVHRFAGEKSFGYTVVPHWSSMSKEGCRALKDCGVKVISTTWGDRTPYNGDPFSLPYGHAARLMHNRQPETMLFTRDTRNIAIAQSVCGYNHMDYAEGMANRTALQAVWDPELEVHFKVVAYQLCVNLTPDDIFDQEMAQYLENEYLNICTHEQYSYPDYFNYQPTHAARILRACELAHQAGYTFFWPDVLGE